MRFREVDSDSSDEAADAIVCARCGEGDDASKMILCDACDSGTHIYCLRPKLSQVPRGRWFCPTCEAQTEAARVARAAIENAARRMVGDRKIDAILASRRRAGAPPGPGGADASVEFLCKFENLSHRKREWLPLWAVRETAEGKLRGHWKRTRASLQNPEVREDFSEEYLRPERVVAVESGEMLVKWHGLGYDEATWEPEEDASEAAVAAATESAKRRDEEERAAREDAGSPGKTAEARAAAAAARSSADAAAARRAVVEGLGESDDSGDEMDAAALHAARERKPEGYGNADIAAELAAELAAFFARAARDPPPSKPAPESRGRGAAGALAFEDFEHLLQRAGTGHGVDAAANRRKAEAAALAAGEQARGPRGGQLDGASNTAGASDLHPRGLALHEYQRQGVLWMLDKLRSGRSAILGDQMGLGKTIQTAVFVDAARALGLLRGPALVVAPLSTVPNWTSELKTWCPGLNCVTYVGNQASRETLRMHEFPQPTTRKGSGARAGESGWRVAPSGSYLDVVLTNYETAMSDAYALRDFKWGAIVVDEGHRLKNYKSKLSQTLSGLDSTFRCLLTGTPLQNNLEELFALLHFLDPAEFKDPARLAEAFTADAEMITKDEETAAHAERQLSNLHTLLAKHMLRRLKKDVLKGLPKKRKVEVACQLTPFQREVYADVLAQNYRAMNHGVSASQRTSLLNVLKQLQKVCNHPFLFPSAEKDAFRAARKSGLAKNIAAAAAKEKNLAAAGERRPELGTIPPRPLDAVLLRTSSAKMQLLAKLLPKLRARGHRVLLFCQMTRMLDVLEDWLRFSGVGLSSVEGGGGGGRGVDSKLNYGRIDGTTPSSKRQRLIESFNAPDSRTFLMLVSTRAGGLGLNLATADTIILYDPDFNPFVDQQAQARAHRMGQRREVAVYQLVTSGTVEERIVELARGKLAIERLVVAAKSSKPRDDADDEDDANTPGARRGGKPEKTTGKAAELAAVLMHGAKGVMCRATRDEREEDASKMSTHAEPTDAEIDRLLDRANLPEEVDGGDGASYLGGVGEHTIAVGGDEGGADDGDGGGEDDGALAEAQLESLLAARAARIDAIEQETLGRGKRERRTVLPDPRKLAGAPNALPAATDPHVTPCRVCDGVDAVETMLRCEACASCAHALCLGMSESAARRDDAWFCGADGAACGGHGEPIVGGRAAAHARRAGASGADVVAV